MDTNVMVEAAIEMLGSDGLEHAEMDEMFLPADTHRDPAQQAGIFHDKMELLDAVVQAMPSITGEAVPTKEEILQLVKQETPEAVLSRFIIRCGEQNTQCFEGLARLIFFEYHNCDHLRAAARQSFICDPAVRLEEALVIMMEGGYIPHCNPRAVAQLWYRVNFVYLLMSPYCELHGGYGDESIFHMLIDSVVCGHTVEDLQNLPPTEDVYAYHGQRDDEEYQLFEKALTLFETRGYKNVSLEEILEGQGDRFAVSYSTKLDLLQDLCAALLDCGFWHRTCGVGTKDMPDGEKLLTQLLQLCRIDSRDIDPRFIRLYRLLSREHSLRGILVDYLVGSLRRSQYSLAAMLSSLTGLSDGSDCEAWYAATVIVYARHSILMEMIHPAGSTDEIRTGDFIQMAMPLVGHIANMCNQRSAG